ncbi:PD-(D/E)XK nuclease family protein [Celeribacter sp.]|uniref:PDDEXK-like family protein n=1 Tax=Celeribacter sp. TaxID=1890673 RepID=UPI003A922254
MPELENLTNLILGPEFTELTQSQDTYCPFDALKVSNSEIRHSNFLANALDPLAPHGFGETVLASFLDCMLDASGDHDLRLELSLTDIGRVEILREFRNMDLVIILEDFTPKTVFVIELKVHAKEHSNQLSRYEEIAEHLWDGYKIRYFLVSPTGMEGSSAVWNALGFSALCEALERATKASAGTPNSRQMLEAYVSMLRRKFVPDEKMESLAKKLWQKHGQTLEYLMSQRPSPMRDISAKIQSTDVMPGIISEIKDRTGVLLQQDSSSSTYCRLFVPAWRKNPSMVHGDFTESRHLIVFETEFYGERIHTRMIIGRGDMTMRRNLYEALKDATVDLGNCKKLTDQWTRLASKTIRREKNIEEANEERVEALVAIARKEMIAFACTHLPSYDKVILSTKTAGS